MYNRGCISSLCSGRLNQQCQVFFLEAVYGVFHADSGGNIQTGQKGGSVFMLLITRAGAH